MNETSNQQKWYHHPVWNGSFSWGAAAFLVLTPIFCLLAVPSYIYQWGLHAPELVSFFVLFYLSGLSITAGYHRLFSHQSYDAHPVVKFFYLVFGAAAMQNSAYKWSSDHRYHHRFVDKESDPYNIGRGFFYAHMGWIFFSDPKDRSFQNAKDLASDPLVMWQDKYYWPLCLGIGFVLPTLVGWFFGRPFGGFLIAGLLRILIVHHFIYFINSVAHTFGTRPYSTKTTARDCWWLTFVSNGEGYHNYHHAFANDYRNGVRWYHLDISKWLIYGLSQVGLSSNLKRTPKAQILKAQLETAYEQFRAKEIPLSEQLEATRASIEAKLQDFQLRYREFQAWKENRAQENERIWKIRRRFLRKRLHAELRMLELAVYEYKATLQFYAQA